MAIAAMVSTEATMAMCVMKVLTLQKMVPNTQSLGRVKHEKSLNLVTTCYCSITSYFLILL